MFSDEHHPRPIRTLKVEKIIPASEVTYQLRQLADASSACTEVFRATLYSKAMHLVRSAATENMPVICKLPSGKVPLQ